MSIKTLVGTVVSNKMDKTIVVKIERYIKHPLYKKFVKRSKKYMAHDEGNIYNIGDTVTILETKPYSKNKCWKVTDSK